MLIPFYSMSLIENHFALPHVIAKISTWLCLLEVSYQYSFYWVGLLAPRPTPNLGDQASEFMTPEDTMAWL
jgi:hypothetical protein